MSDDVYRVYYRTDASAHYVDLGKQAVEISRREALIELNGQRVRCAIEDTERPAPGNPHTDPVLYLRRKAHKRQRD